MYNNYDYKKSLDKIKSVLFDLYEDQEMIVGTISDEKKRNEHVEKYIQVKNIALQLIDSITNLYEERQFGDKVLNNIEESDNQTEDEVDEEITEEESDDEAEDEVDEGITKEESDDEAEDEVDEGITKEESDNQSEDEIDEELEKIYLDGRNGTKPNYAYVPQDIYEDIKTNAILTSVNNNLYKIDDLKRKGIIVRNDQFMKLSLSRHRQESVLKEAKEFRIEQAKKSRKKLEKQEI